MDNYSESLSLVSNKIMELREITPSRQFDKDKLAEVEINKFYYEGRVIDRIMIVLRSSGCEHYGKTGGCSMCSHFNGTIQDGKITDQNYINQWHSVMDGSCLEVPVSNFSLNNYSVVCLYNLGSLLNPNEVSVNAIKHIFTDLNQFEGIEKVIIESRAEYVDKNILHVIKQCYGGLVEVGIGVESTDDTIRELCHHKGLQDLEVVKRAVDILHEFNYKALAYVNFKPCFLTEQESIDDAIKTSIDCYNMGFDAVSIEPTSLQEYSLVSYLNSMGYYRVPWLWSLQKIVKGVYDGMHVRKMDLRLGGYFDEEVLSGSQGEGFAERNEIFPFETSSNCRKCSGKFVENIKLFNITNDIEVLYDIEKCETCYEQWENACNVEDKRSISQRIFDILGN